MRTGKWKKNMFNRETAEKNRKCSRGRETEKQTEREKQREGE